MHACPEKPSCFRPASPAPVSRAPPQMASVPIFARPLHPTANETGIIQPVPSYRLPRTSRSSIQTRAQTCKGEKVWRNLPSDKGRQRPWKTNNTPQATEPVAQQLTAKRRAFLLLILSLPVLRSVSASNTTSAVSRAILSQKPANLRTAFHRQRIDRQECSPAAVYT
ncbi:hypothetical protein MAPG_01975 [Magnaporthiopsis poae ATCC 64411]|uniref:Uncharacterized protein n=1 Tax=Magnaporthiopsis poae (strain ATCC 64411 / 73-15) TaxID=644358 RepID=A0A0C4DQ37_MAGP6|nr:hypothetical protein MAPG_01975 [Magnaporthiopsis poae ATCC 64411]